MSDTFHRDLRKRFGDRVPFASEYIEVPAAIETVIIDFFERMTAFDPDVRVQRVWLDDGKLRIAIAGSRPGLDDIIADAEAAAADLLRDRFPLHPDSVWHDAMVDRYGDAVPAIDHLQIRRGLQSVVGDMYAQLHDLDLLRHVDILSIVTRDAGLVVIDARYHAGIFEDDRIALDFALEHHNERLNESWSGRDD